MEKEAKEREDLLKKDGILANQNLISTEDLKEIQSESAKKDSHKTLTQDGSDLVNMKYFSYNKKIRTIFGDQESIKPVTAILRDKIREEKLGFRPKSPVSTAKFAKPKSKNYKSNQKVVKNYENLEE